MGRPTTSTYSLMPPQNEIEIESRTQSPETIAAILKDEGYDGVTVEVASDRPGETSSSVPAPAAGGDEPAGGGGEGETGEPGAESETAQQTQEQENRKSGSARLKKRIHEKDAEIGTLKSKVEELDRKLAEFTAGQPAETKPPATAEETARPAETQAETDDPEPLLEDFDAHEDYVKALAKWTYREQRREEKKREQETREREESDRKTKTESEARTAAEAEQKAAEERWNSQLEEARATHPDFDQVALSDTVIASPVMVATVRELDEGCELAYWLGKHPEESERIARLTELPEKYTRLDVNKAFRLVTREFDKIIEKLSSGESAATTASREARGPAATPAPTTLEPAATPKPTPLNPVGSRGANTRSLVEADPDAIRNASNDEWRKATGDPRA